MQPISCANSTGLSPLLNDDETNLYLSINHNLLIHNSGITYIDYAYHKSNMNSSLEATLIDCFRESFKVLRGAGWYDGLGVYGLL